MQRAKELRVLEFTMDRAARTTHRDFRDADGASIVFYDGLCRTKSTQVRLGPYQRKKRKNNNVK